MTTIPHFIDGRARAGDPVIPVYNPATGEVSAHAPAADAALLDEVVASARAGAQRWRAASLSTRTNVLFTFRQLLARHADELAAIITREHGKTLADARGELARGLENVEYACGLTEHLKGEFSTQVADGVDVHSMREPVGVVAAMTPFNFPAMVPLWMTANALAAGNAVVLKPSERDPSVSVRLGELLAEAGLPDGVFNVVHGNADTVNALIAHPGRRRGELRRVDAGRAPRPPRRRPRTASASRRWAGPRTTWSSCPTPTSTSPPTPRSTPASARPASGAWPSASSSRSAASPTSSSTRIAERVDKLTVGPGDDPASDFGPLITREHRDRVATLRHGRERRRHQSSCATARRWPSAPASSSGPACSTGCARARAPTTTRSSARC